ncbi:hypothetical protein YC2023_060326 [Brassica napus]
MLKTYSVPDNVLENQDTFEKTHFVTDNVYEKQLKNLISLSIAKIRLIIKRGKVNQTGNRTILNCDPNIIRSASGPVLKTLDKSITPVSSSFENGVLLIHRRLFTPACHYANNLRVYRTPAYSPHTCGIELLPIHPAPDA